MVEKPLAHEIVVMGEWFLLLFRNSFIFKHKHIDNERDGQDDMAQTGHTGDRSVQSIRHFHCAVNDKNAGNTAYRHKDRR